MMGFVDTGLTSGTHSYQVVASDSDGNRVFGSRTTVAIPATTPPTTAYGQLVRANGASLYWPMNESSGTTVTDRAASSSGPPTVGVTDGRADSGVSVEPAGRRCRRRHGRGADRQRRQPRVRRQLRPDGGLWLGHADGSGHLHRPAVDPDLGALTASKRGGRLLGFGDLQNGNSGHRDRHLYMDGSGRLFFGVKAQNNTLRTVSSTTAYNNNRWHMVTATMSAAGMRLYVDGRLVAQRTDTTAGEAYLGYWRLGGDTLDGWPSKPPTRNFIGSVDEVAIYPTALSAAQVQAQYELSGVNQPPTATFTTSTSGLTASVNGGGSSDPDGTISSYAWAFGDGGTAAGATASHAYAMAGTHTVTLTVSDNRGAKASTTRQVTVSPPPLASDTFDRTVTGGWGSADVGGAWSTTSVSAFSVANGAGNVVMAAGSGGSAYLTAVSGRSVDLVTVLRYDKAATGTISTSVVARRAGTSDYRVKVSATASSTKLALVRTVSGASTVLASQVVPGLVIRPTTEINLRFQAVGSGTTTLRTRLWVSGTTEPTTWALSATDTTTLLQSAGAIGVTSALSASATNAPLTLRVGNLRARPL